MTSRSRKFFDLDCGDSDDPVRLEILDTGEVVFHNFDLEVELAAQELGFAPSDCYVVWYVTRYMVPQGYPPPFPVSQRLYRVDREVRSLDTALMEYATLGDPDSDFYRWDELP